MRYLSVCSGIEAASAAWHDFGWTPVGFSEIEAFPSAVLAHRFPHVPNFGDMTKYKEWPLETGSVDLLVGGTPCQSFSVAGLRKGLADPRGNLMLTYLGIADHFRVPWLLWENVPGVLSSSDGRDFGAFLGALGELGYRWAYRVLDAQHFGVPQRRRRVFVVARLGDGPHPAEVLFEPESLRGNPAASRKARKGSAAPVGEGVAVGRGFRMTAFGEYADDDSASTLKQRDYKDATDLVCATGSVTHALTRSQKGATEDGTGRGTPIVPVAFDGYNQTLSTTCQTLRADKSDGDHVGMVLVPSSGQASIAVAFAFDGSQSSNPKATHQYTEECSPPLIKSRPPNVGYSPPTMHVRRLTPIECERLQGFPDGWTDIPYRGKPAADGPRYKALGNSMAVPVMRWIGQRIKDA